MASANTQTNTDYAPTESVEDNLKQIQSREKAEKAKIKNTAAKVKSAAKKGAAFVEKGFLNLNGIAKSAATVGLIAGADDVSEEETKVMSGTLELPDGVDNQINECAKAAADGKHPKMLSWEPFADKLSVPALNKAWDVGLIDENNERHKLVGDIEAKYAGVAQTAVKSAVSVFVPKNIKVLPELVTDKTKDFLSTAYDMSEAMTHVSDYLIGDDSQLQHMYEASNMGMSAETVEAASDGLVHDDVEVRNQGRVAKAEEFAAQVAQNGMHYEMESQGMQAGY